MNLVIKLKGEIQNSNFFEWKNDLILQIKSVNTELNTDEDFLVAIEYVKAFKHAEKSLKEAKKLAIEQASDIQKLFSAVDEISEKTRQTRLLLEHQINVRKLEIKRDCIQSGIELLREFIDNQNDDFKLIDHSVYLNYNRFELAVKGKAGVKGIQSAISYLCDKIKIEIMQKSAEVTNNGIIIDALPSKHRVLFQDRNSLLVLSVQELRLTIDKRIALFNEQSAETKASNALDALQKLEDVDLNSNTTLTEQKYKLIIDIFSSKETAIEIARSIRQSYANNISILSIRLNRNYD